MSERFLKMSVLAMLATIGLGIFMSASGNHSQSGLHAHLGLLGWFGMAVFAVVYRLWPATDEGWLAAIHFWAYAVGFVIAMTGVGLLLGSNPGVGEPLAGIGSMLCGVGALAFAIQVLRTRLTTASQDPS